MPGPIKSLKYSWSYCTLYCCCLSAMSPVKHTKNAYIVVDPLSSGSILATKLTEKGHNVIRLDSRKLPEYLTNSARAGSASFVATISHDYTIEDKAVAIRKTVGALLALPFNIKAVIPGCEAGVILSDDVSAVLDLPSNGRELTHARRDKFFMIQRLHETGVPAVVQAVATSLEEAQAFVKLLGEQQPACRKVVCKPRGSAGSDGVSIFPISESEKITKAYDLIAGKKNTFGEMNRGVLVQEFLEGDEYVVDTVSLSGGHHKVVAIWKYDKRPANGGPVVYWGMSLFESADGSIEKILMEYVLRVINSLGVRTGPSHCEVILTPAGPRLVEMGARPHGGAGSFLPLANRAIGYNQLDVVIDAMLAECGDEAARARFNAIPARPAAHRCTALEFNLITWRAGILHSMPGMERVRGLDSYVAESLNLSPGDKLPLTVDFNTTPGSLLLAHEDPEVVAKDRATLREMEQAGELFQLQSNAKRTETTKQARRMPDGRRARL